MTIQQIADTSTGLNARAERALALLEEYGEFRTLGDNLFEVPSHTGRGSYRVRYGGEVESCSCRDFGFGHVCKHLLAIGAMHATRRSGVKEVRTFAVAAGDPFLAAAKRDAACPSCFGGRTTITVEDGAEERYEAVLCRRCG